MSLQTPVALFVFNRPDLTRRVFEALAAQQPRALLVVADGPRHDAERELCEQARAVASRVDWPCEVQTNFSPVNLGCKVRVSSGLDWVFGRVPEAIILEDDCLPAPSFFPFCEAMLARFRDDERVMHISGDNFQKRRPTPYSYYFSRYAHVWGWASWRRAWAHYDVTMSSWPARKAALLASCPTRRERDFWEQAFNCTYAGQIDTWDYQWMYACWNVGAWAINPAENLVSNLGFRADATHTKAESAQAELSVGSLGELSHPPQVERLAQADADTIRQMMPKPTLRAELGKLKRALIGARA